jgi:DNA-binding transcriptional LysR family regulator
MGPPGGQEGDVVELHQLRCFLAVVEEGGFNRATTRLHISQPALSYQIKQLEQELGAILFHRRPGGVSTTEAGRVLTQFAREVLEAVSHARSAVQELAEGVTGEIRIGTANSVGIYFLPRVLWRVREKYPSVRPTVLYRHSNAIMELLYSNRLELALVANPKPDRRLDQQTIIDERISLFCGREHPLHGRSALSPQELNRLQFISLSAKSPTGQMIREYMTQLGVDAEPVVSTDNVETVKKMVEFGLGVAFLPDMVTGVAEVNSDENNSLLWRISVGPPLRRRIAIVTWKSGQMSRATTAFIEELKRHAAEWNTDIDTSKTA